MTRPAEGLRPISDILPSVVGKIVSGMSLTAKYTAHGGLVLTPSSGRLQTPEDARISLQLWIEDALTTPVAELVDVDVLHIVSLIHAIREAEGRGPTPPAANEATADRVAA